MENVSSKKLKKIYINPYVREWGVKAGFAVAALFSIIAAIMIFVFLFASGAPTISEIGFFKFIFGREWNPANGEYGIAATIVGSIYSTVGAMIVGGALGFFTAVYISAYCPKRLKEIFGQLVNLLAGIPSVIYGFFGILIVQPILGNFSDNGSGAGLLCTSLILGFMVMPTIISISVSALDAVPKAYYEGARAMGDTHSQAVFGAIVPAAKSGITAGFILGVGRAVGETMAVAMICGGAKIIPDGLFQSYSTMTSLIVTGIGELAPGNTAYGAMVGTGCILFLFVSIINLAVQIVTRDKKSGAVNIYKKQSKADLFFGKIVAFKNARFHKITKIKAVLCYVCSAISVCGLGAIVLFILIKGLPHLGTEGLFSATGSYSGAQTILPSIVSSLMTVLLSLTIAVPIGLGGAVFLVEYAKKRNIFTRIIKSGIEILAGIPSIVYGLFGNAFFVHICGFGTSILSGSLTIAIMVIPIILRSSEESIKAVPEGYSEGSYALGAGKARTVFKTVLPSALPGIFTAIILAVGRIIGESAPLMLTSGNGGMDALPDGYMSKGTSLAVLLYWLNKEYTYVNEAWATAAILLITVLILNLVSTVLVKITQRKILGKV
jgi:phosphate transport system permease protein